MATRHAEADLDPRSTVVLARIAHEMRQLSAATAAVHLIRLGVGLAVARQLVELHGRAIAVASRGRGLGTEVVVTQPRSAPAAVATALMRRM